MLVKKRISLRIEESRFDKLHRVAEQKKKTMTQIVEDWLDTVIVEETKK